MYPQTNLVPTLQSIPWFVDLIPETLIKLSRISSIHQVSSGTTLFVEGGSIDYLFVILDGQFSVDIKMPNTGCVPMYLADPLDIIGWSAMTSVVRHRTCSARATVDSRVLAIDGPGLQSLCNEDYHLGYIVMRRIANVAASRLLSNRVKLLTRIGKLTRKPVLPQPDFE
jgi:CRP-like cAMP-binding protein